MHVLILPSWYPLNDSDLNGCFFREQAQAILRSGVKVGVVAPQFRSLRSGLKAINGSYETEVWMDGQIPTYFKHGVFWFPKVPYFDLNRWVNAGLKLFERYITEQGMPDVIHVHSLLLAGPLAYAIHKKYGIPYCVTEHSSLFARNLVSNWQWSHLITTAKSSYACIAVSQSLALLLEKKLSDTQWSVLPNLLENQFAENRVTLRKKKQFCAVARLHENKGFDVLINAFSILNREKPDFKLIIGGDGPEGQKLKSLAQDLKLTDVITFTGELSREKVRLLMEESMCFVVSSYVETFGVVVIEALSQGTPVISTKCGGPESIIENGDGMLVEVAKADDLALAMKKMAENPELYNAELIRKRCLERFSEEAFISRVNEIYKHCVKENISA